QKNYSRHAGCRAASESADGNVVARAACPCWSKTINTGEMPVLLKTSRRDFFPEGCGLFARRGFELVEERIATGAGDLEVFRPERAANPLLRVGSRMDCVVEKPRAVVIPEVMVGIFRADADSEELGYGGHGA